MWDLKKFSKKIAIISDDNSRLSYKDLSDQTDIIGKNLRPGSLIFCLCSNSVGCLLGYVAFLNNKVVQVMLDSKINNDYLDELIEVYSPEYLWVPNENLNITIKGEIICTVYEYSLVRVNLIKKYDLNSDLAVLLPTSGTTGSRKMVRLSCDNLKVNAKSIIQYLEINSNEKTITSLPMHYSYGLSVVNTHLLAGGSISITKFSVMQKQFWDKVKQDGITSLSGVPYTFELMDRLGFADMNLPLLKTLCQAGGKLSLELNQKIAAYSKELGKKFFVMYGATEASPRMSYLPHTYAQDKCGSIGIAIPGGQLTIIDIEGNEINKPGVVGELQYQGPNVAMGYANNGSDLSETYSWKDIFLTGDLAEMDSDGFFYIVGRKKRIIKLFGNRINLDEIEHRLKEIFPENNFACIGDDKKVSIFHCDETLNEKIVAILRRQWNFQPKSYQIFCIDSIPKNTSSKTDYLTLKDLC